MQSKLDAAEWAKREPIAIIGMGCRFPGGAKKLPPYNIFNPALDSLIENSHVIRQSNYFSLPINIKYRIWKELRISFAPQVSYMTKNDDYFNQCSAWRRC